MAPGCTHGSRLFHSSRLYHSFRLRAGSSLPVQLSHSWTYLLLSLWFGFLVGLPALVSLVISEVRVDPTAIPKRGT